MDQEQKGQLAAAVGQLLLQGKVETGISFDTNEVYGRMHAAIKQHHERGLAYMWSDIRPKPNNDHDLVLLAVSREITYLAGLMCSLVHAKVEANKDVSGTVEKLDELIARVETMMKKEEK